jgi:hypothetical protein
MREHAGRRSEPHPSPFQSRDRRERRFCGASFSLQHRLQPTFRGRIGAVQTSDECEFFPQPGQHAGAIELTSYTCAKEAR